MYQEPQIEINGKQLSSAQAMAVRVACASFMEEMNGNPHALGDDEHGRRMAAAYADRLREVMQFMIGL